MLCVEVLKVLGSALWGLGCRVGFIWRIMGLSKYGYNNGC